MKVFRLLTAILFVAGISLQTKAVAVDLQFDEPTTATNGTHQLGSYISSNTVNFLNVANQDGQSVDMRLTATVSGVYSYVGAFPDYNDGDLGFLYQANSAGTGMLQFQMEFFASGSNFSTRYTLNEFNLLIYDVDGESFQTEAIRAFMGDGLYSYRLANSPNSVSATSNADNIFFNGPGFNIDEHDASGAVLLNYRNTNSILLQFESTTAANSPLPNGVFSAIDGDPTVANNSFQQAVVVPEPSSALSLLIGGLILIVRRRRI